MPGVIRPRRNLVIPNADIVRPGLLAQYPCNDGSGGTLHDRSGNGYDGTLGLSGSFIPTWSIQGIVFAGGAKIVQLPVALYPLWRTVQIWFNVTLQTNGQAIFACDSNSDGLWLSTDDAKPGRYGDFVTPITVGASQARGPNCLTYVAGGGGVQECLYWNTTPTAGYLSRGTGYTPPSVTRFWLGLLHDSSIALLGSTIYYALFYNRCLSPGEIQQNHLYVSSIAARRGVFFGNTQDQRTFIPFHGDSLTAGKNASPGSEFPAQTMALLSGSYWYSNLGIGGQTIGGGSGMLAVGPTLVDTLFNEYTTASPSRAVHLWGGTNDIGSGTGQATNAYNNTVSYGTARHAVGWKVIVMGIAARNGLFAGGQNHAGFETDRQAIRTNMLADSSTSLGGNLYTGASYCDVYVDLAADANVGVDGSTSNATYWNADQVHMTNAGYAVVAGYAKAALNQLGIT